jgi:phosphatidylglycerol:prolipoprotein diacylglycerol transferase
MYPIFHASPHIHIPLYLLVMSLAFTISIIYFYKRSTKLHLPAKTSTEISLMIMVGGFLGARLFHIIFEYPQYYWDHFSDVFKFYNGGFVFYGGLIGGSLAAYYYISKMRQNFGNWLDAFALVLPVGYMIGRLGCLMAGCCYGKQCDLPWAITFGPGVEAPPGIPLHPTQIYSIIFGAITWFGLYSLEKKRTVLSLIQPSGSLFYLWMVFHGASRLVVEQFRGDFRGDIVGGFSVSFFLSFAMIAIGFFMITKNKSTTP